MRIIGLAGLLFIFVILWNLLRNGTLKREYACGLLGFSLFLGGPFSADASIISWPLWPSYTRGILVTLTDCTALALLLTSRKVAAPIPFKIVLGVFTGIIALSIPLSTVPMATVFVLWQTGVIVMLFVVFATEAMDLKNVRGIFVGISFGLVMEGLVVIYQKSQGVVQAPGTAFHQNTLGMMIELAILPLFALVLDGEKRKLVWAGLLGGLIALGGGGSRAGLGLVSLGLLITLILSFVHSRSAHKFRVLGIVALGLCIVVPVAVSTLSERFGAKSLITEETERRNLENAARWMSEDHPLGVGANMYVTVANLGGYARRAGVGWHQSNRAAPVHHAYLLARAELGWHGLLAFILLIAVPLIAGLRLIFRHKSTPGVGITVGATAALTTLLIHNFYEWAIFSYNCMALLALNLGVIAAALRKTRQARRAPAMRVGGRASQQLATSHS